MTADDNTIAHLRPNSGISTSTVPSRREGRALVSVCVVRRHVVRLAAVREDLQQNPARNHKFPTTYQPLPSTNPPRKSGPVIHTPT